MTPDEYCRRYGLPASHHRMTLASDIEGRRKWPVGWGLAIVTVFSALVWAAIFFKH